MGTNGTRLCGGIEKEAPQVCMPPSPTTELVDLQKAFFRTGATRDVEWRQRTMRALVGAITAAADRISDAQEADRVAPSSFAGSAAMLAKAVDFYASGCESWAKPVELADTLPEFMQGGVRCEWLRVSEPKGVVLNIAPWNAPVLLSILPAMGAIAAGNTVVIKPPDATPRTSALLKQLVAEACPKTAVAVVEGGVEAVNSLIDSNVDHIMFTGGTSIGRVIMARAAQTLTPVTLELGGKNPVMIDEMGDRLLAAAVKEIVGVKTFFSGEFCQAHDYCLVVEGMWERFTTALAAAIEELGPARLRPIIHRRHYDRVKHMLLTHTGTNAPSEVECDDGGMRVPVTAVLQPGVGDAVMQDEVFGPVVSVVKVESVDAAAEYVQSLPTGTPLLSYYYGESGERADQWMLQTSSGSLAINAGPMRMQSNLHAGIVGVGNSGLGGCSIWGEQTFRTFSHTRHVVRAKAGGFAGSVWGPGPVPAAEGSEIDL